MARGRTLKILNLSIGSCSECPYCRHNTDYNIGYDAGWDCDHDDAPADCRIVDEGHDMKKRKAQRVLESGVPKWCPLPNQRE